MPKPRRSERISPTAYATGYFWYSQGMGPKRLTRPQGRLMHYALRPAVLGTRWLGGPSLDAVLLVRHRGIDERLDAAIASGRVSQVIELASGLSPRGIRYAGRYHDDIRYIETDLPHMVAAKRRLLQLEDRPDAAHRVVTLDALAEDGPNSLAALAATLDPEQGLAIITEGLLPYFDAAQAARVWHSIATTLQRFRHGFYLSDLYLASDHRSLISSLFARGLQVFVRGRVHFHHRNLAEATAALQAQGYGEIHIYGAANLDSTRALAHTAGSEMVRVVEAWTARR